MVASRGGAEHGPCHLDAGWRPLSLGQRSLWIAFDPKLVTRSGQLPDRRRNYRALEAGSPFEEGRRKRRDWHAATHLDLSLVRPHHHGARDRVFRRRLRRPTAAAERTWLP